MSLWFFHSSIPASGTHARLLPAGFFVACSEFNLQNVDLFVLLLYDTLVTFDCGSARGGRGRERERERKQQELEVTGRTGRPRLNWLDYALSVPVRGKSFFARARPLLLQLGQHVRDRWPLNVPSCNFIFFFVGRRGRSGYSDFTPTKKKQTNKNTQRDIWTHQEAFMFSPPLGRRNPVWTPARCLLGGAAVKQV